MHHRKAKKIYILVQLKLSNAIKQAVNIENNQNQIEKFHDYDTFFFLQKTLETHFTVNFTL